MVLGVRQLFGLDRYLSNVIERDKFGPLGYSGPAPLCPYLEIFNTDRTINTHKYLVLAFNVFSSPLIN